MTDAPITMAEVSVTLADGIDVHVGTLRSFVTSGRQKPSANFEYSATYLRTPGAYSLSPDLPLATGFAPAPLTQEMFGAFADAGPDSWGKRLLDADHRRRARLGGTKWERLSDLDYLVRVSDRSRQGALRFSTGAARGPYLAEPVDEIPDLVDLARLVRAATGFEDDEDDAVPLDALLPAGTTQGGARPKTAVTNDRGRLAIAKLPHPGDRWDVLAWEATTMQLAADAGIDTQPFQLHRSGIDRSVFVVERFDRGGDGRRLGYLSARSLTATRHGSAVDYTFLAEHLTSPGDGHELFRRVAFTLLVGNIDDHFRNHGVLRRRGGWALSPVFDVNPHPRLQSLDATPISPEDDPSDRDIRLLLDNSEYFGIDTQTGLHTITEVELATREWARVAARFGIEADAIPSMTSAFDNDNRTRALELVGRERHLTIDLAERRDATPDQVRKGSVWVPPHVRSGRPVGGYWRHERTRPGLRGGIE